MTDSPFHCRRAWLFLPLLAAIGFLAGCGKPDPVAQGQRPPPEVGLYEVAEKPLQLTSKLPGRTRAVSYTHLTLPTTPYV